MKKLIFISIIMFSTVSTSQWRYTEKNNEFDGKIKAATVIGKGNDYPYNNPKLILNHFVKTENFNLYISDAGYFNSGVDVIMVFDTEPNVFYKSYNQTTSGNNKSIFIDEFYVNDDLDNRIGFYEVLQKLKSNNSISIRVEDKYGKNDLKFTLSGSTRAINLVVGVERIKNALIEVNEKKLQKINDANRRDSLFLAEQQMIKVVNQKTDSLFIYFQEKILPKIEKRISELELEIVYEDLLNEIKEFKSKIKLSIESGRELLISDFEKMNLLVFESSLNIKLSSKNNRSYWFSNPIKYSKDYSKINQALIDKFFDVYSGEFEIYDSYEYSNSKKKKKLNKGLLKLSKNSSSLSFKGLNLKLEDFAPQDYELKDSELFFKIDDSNFKKAKIKFITPNNVKLETGINFDVKKFKPNDSYEFTIPN